MNRARSTLQGKIAEQNRASITGVFSSILRMHGLSDLSVDYIIFNGLIELADEKSRGIRIVFMDVKKGTGALTRTQRVIRKTV